MLDEPHPAYFGGTVSAPAFAEIAQSTLSYLEIEPSKEGVPNETKPAT
jgi:hypothetical protein